MIEKDIEKKSRHILDDIFAERARQVERFGWPQRLPDGNRADIYKPELDERRKLSAPLEAAGTLHWVDVLEEEFLEAAAAPSIGELRQELIQVAAVAIQWIEDIDTREPSPAPKKA